MRGPALGIVPRGIPPVGQLSIRPPPGPQLRQAVHPQVQVVRPDVGPQPPQLLLPQAPGLFEVAKRLLDLPAMMPPKVEVGWPARPATGPRRVYRAGRGLGFFSFARRVLLAHVRGRACSSRRRRSSAASAQIT